MSNTTSGTKHDSEKPRAHLVLAGFASALEEVCKLGTFGAAKYGPNNWQGVAGERYHDAMMRHYLTYAKGVELDPETGMHQLIHIAWNALACYEQTLRAAKSKPVRESGAEGVRTKHGRIGLIDKIVQQLELMLSSDLDYINKFSCSDDGLYHIDPRRLLLAIETIESQFVKDQYLSGMHGHDVYIKTGETGSDEN